MSQISTNILLLTLSRAAEEGYNELGNTQDSRIGARRNKGGLIHTELPASGERCRLVRLLEMTRPSESLNFD